MIIELFGPPGVGKTTFAKCLAERLREHGHAVELTMSVRPAEQVAARSRQRQGRKEAAREPPSSSACAGLSSRCSSSCTGPRSSRTRATRPLIS